MAAKPPTEGRRSLEEIFTSLDQAADSDDAFLRLILEGAARRDPELPELLRAGAIPRALDAEIVGVLRDAPEDAEGNRRLLAAIAEYRFVLRRPDGDLVYHDNTRDALLADWRSTDEKRGRFGELNRALAAFHEAGYAESLNSDRRLGKAADLIARANPGRLRRLTAAIQATVTQTLLKAVYHRLLADPVAGFDSAQDAYFDLEGHGRVAVCRSLVAFTRDFLERLPPDEHETAPLLWLDYYDARLNKWDPGAGGEPAEATLLRLIEDEQVPAQLHTWALGDLAQLYEFQMRLDRAVETRLRLTGTEPGVDDFNAPVRHTGLGILYARLDDYPAAVRQFELAIEVEEVAEVRQDLGITARLKLSTAKAELGDWEAAFDAAVEALLRVRTTFAHLPNLQGDAATEMARLLSTFDPAASDCAMAEAVALADGPDERAGQLAEWITILCFAGRVRTGRALMDRLESEPDMLDPAQGTEAGRALLRALLLHCEGRESEAADEYSRLIEETSERPDQRELRLAALMLRGMCRIALGETATAAGDFTAAENGWIASGCPVSAASPQIQLADARSRAGDVEAARNLLELAEKRLPPGLSEKQRELLVARGDMHRRLGEWRAAEDQYERALAVAAARRQLDAQVSLLRKLAALQEQRCAWARSSEYHRRAADAAARLDLADSHNPTATEREVERRNGEGMRSFYELDDWPAALDRARQLLTVATKADPQNLWPLLNLSFVYAQQEDWNAAADALAQAMVLAPRPMRTAALWARLSEHVLESAQALRRGDDPARAVAAIEAALAALPDGPPPADLARLRGAHGTLLAIRGDVTGARESFRSALTGVDDGSLLVEAVGRMLGGVDDVWEVDSVLETIERDPATASTARASAAALRRELGSQLDALLGLAADPFAVSFTIPTAVDVGDRLVPIVDPSQDGGVFIERLIPAMQERIRKSTGVDVPGVLVRANPGLPPDGYRILIDGVPVLIGSVDVGVPNPVAPAAAADLAPESDVVDAHPRTGSPGLWLVLRGILFGAHDDFLTSADYLIHRIEVVLRAHLDRYLGPEEVATLLEEWSERHGDAVTFAIPDADARLRLTWVLQQLVEDRVPITDPPAVLAGVADAGGIGAPSSEVIRAVRARMRDRLPGPQTGRLAITVPPELEAGLLGDAPDGPVGRDEARLAFRRWLGETMEAVGPAITLVTTSDRARELLASLARGESRLVTAVSEAELAPE